MVKTEDFRCTFRSTKVIEVIRTEVYEGKGTEESVGRIVTYYTATDGTFLAKHDPCPEIKKDDVKSSVITTTCVCECGICDVCVSRKKT
jgi:hypothetical protein